MAELEEASQWSVYEAVPRGADGSCDESSRRPFSEELADGGDPLVTVVTKVGLLQAHGWPDARRAMKDKRGHTLLARCDDEEPELWLLKCKPSCWRLYFCVYPKTKRFVFLHAKCKKKNEEDAANATRARRRLRLLARAGGSCIVAFELPTS